MKSKKSLLLLTSLLTLSLGSCDGLSSLVEENTKDTPNTGSTNVDETVEEEVKEETKEESTDDKQDETGKDEPKPEPEEPKEEDPKEEEPKPEEPPVIEKYKVTWYNGSTVLETDNDVVKGTTPVYNGKTPTKASDNDYDYTFIGWNTNSKATSALNPLPVVEKNLDLYAIFSAKAITKYTVKFFNQGKEITNSSKTVKAGKYNIKSDLYSLSNPTKASDSANSYTFKGWATSRPTNDISSNVITEINVSGNISLHACFVSTKNTYTITWMNGSTKYDTTTHAYGETPKPSKGDPTKTKTAQYSYTFMGWNTDSKATTALETLPTVTKNDTYYAVFSQTTNKYKFSLYFDDVLITTSKKFNYGYSFENFKDPVYLSYVLDNYFEPFKVNDEGYVNNFAGWSRTKGATSGTQLGDLPDLVEDTDYYAAFSTSTEKVLIYEWKTNSDGKLTMQNKRTIQDCLDSNMLKLNGTVITKFVSPNLQNNNNFNLYLNESKFTEIGSINGSNRALAGCAATNIYMPSITKIGDGGLSVSELKTINANNVTTIGEGAFKASYRLKTISIPKLTALSAKAFEECSSLENVTVGNSLTAINQFAFKDCTSLKNITIPKSVKTIERSTTTIEENNQVKYLKNCMPFNGCEKLETITVDSANTTFRSENNALISKSDNALLVATNKTTTVPTSVKVIKPRAFDSLSNLTQVTIPTSITTIEADAFSHCLNLQKVIYSGTYSSLKSKCPSSNVSKIFTLRNGDKITIQCSDQTVTV